MLSTLILFGIENINIKDKSSDTDTNNTKDENAVIPDIPTESFLHEGKNFL